jgi:glycosyltransferase involved in cell wall biosynthesis
MPAMPLKVIHVSPLYFSEHSVLGGGERYVQELATAMAHLPGVQVRLVSFGRQRRVTHQHGFTTSIYPVWFYLGNKNVSPVSPLFLKELFWADIIHCHQYQSVVTDLCVLFARAFRKKVFVSDHGGGGKNYAHRLHTGDYVHGFLLVTEYLARQYERYRDRVTVIYGGFNPARFYPRPLARERRAICVARLVPFKGQNWLIQAVPPDLELRLIGKAYDSRYEQDLRRLAEGKRVCFKALGADDAAQEELAGEYSSAGVKVLPSVYQDMYGKRHTKSEILGLVLLEAMGCATPTVVTNVGGMPELVVDGETGFVVPPYDPAALWEKMQVILDDPALARRLGQAGRARALELFTWERVARRCLEAYLSTTDPPAR